MSDDANVVVASMVITDSREESELDPYPAPCTAFNFALCTASP